MEHATEAITVARTAIRTRGGGEIQWQAGAGTVQIWRRDRTVICVHLRHLQPSAHSVCARSRCISHRGLPVWS